MLYCSTAGDGKDFGLDYDQMMIMSMGSPLCRDPTTIAAHRLGQLEFDSAGNHGYHMGDVLDIHAQPDFLATILTMPRKPLSRCAAKPCA